MQLSGTYRDAKPVLSCSTRGRVDTGENAQTQPPPEEYRLDRCASDDAKDPASVLGVRVLPS